MISDIATLTHSGISCLVNSSPFYWVIDSGASTHFTGKFTLFSAFNRSNTTLVTFVDDNSKYITHTFNPISSLSLFDVHRIHGVPVNLLYVSSLIKSMDSITFSPTSCVFEDLQTKKVIGGGMSVMDYIFFVR